MKAASALRHSLITIAEAASRSGLTARAIRLYEARGLLSPGRDPQGVRCYTLAEVDHLGFIASARRAGLSIRQIQDLLQVGRLKGPEAQSQRILSLCEAQVAAIERQRCELESLVARAANHGLGRMLRRA